MKVSIPASDSGGPGNVPTPTPVSPEEVFKIVFYLERLRSFSSDDPAGGVELNLTLRFPDHVTLNENAHTHTSV